MKKQLLILFSIFTMYSSVTFGDMDSPTSCGSDMAEYSCDRCFNGGFLYEKKGGKLSVLEVSNNGDKRNVYFAKELETGITTYNRSNGAVSFTKPAFEFSSDLFKFNRSEFKVKDWAWVNHPDGTLAGSAVLDPGMKAIAIRTPEGSGLSVSSVDKSKVNDENRGLIRDGTFVIVYQAKAHFRDSSTKRWTGSNTVTNCQVIGVHFCGDGYIESDIETCDDGGQNGQSGKCNTSCSGITK